MTSETVLVLFLCLFGVLAASFIVLMATLFVVTAAELLGVDARSVLGAVLVVFALMYFAWFVMGMPLPGYDGPQPILEGRCDD